MIGAYLDVGNLYHVIKEQYDKKINYKALVNMLRDRFPGVDIHAYGCQKGNEADAFIAHLETLGIDVHYKRTRCVAPGKYKGDWDLGLALDVVDGECDVVIIGSNDGDMQPLIEWCTGKVYVLGTMISGEIKAEQIIIGEDLLK